MCWVNGHEKISTYAPADTAINSTFHHVYGRATTARTYTAMAINVISVAVAACVWCGDSSTESPPSELPDPPGLTIR